MFNFELTYLSQFSIVVELFGQYGRFRYELSLDMTHMWWYGYLRYPQQPYKNKLLADFEPHGRGRRIFMTTTVNHRTVGGKGS